MRGALCLPVPATSPVPNRRSTVITREGLTQARPRPNDVRTRHAVVRVRGQLVQAPDVKCNMPSAASLPNWPALGGVYGPPRLTMMRVPPQVLSHAYGMKVMDSATW